MVNNRFQCPLCRVPISIQDPVRKRSANDATMIFIDNQQPPREYDIDDEHIDESALITRIRSCRQLPVNQDHINEALRLPFSRLLQQNGQLNNFHMVFNMNPIAFDFNWVSDLHVDGVQELERFIGRLRLENESMAELQNRLRHDRYLPNIHRYLPNIPRPSYSYTEEDEDDVPHSLQQRSISKSTMSPWLDLGLGTVLGMLATGVSDYITDTDQTDEANNNQKYVLLPITAIYTATSFTTQTKFIHKACGVGGFLAGIALYTLAKNRYGSNSDITDIPQFNQIRIIR